MNLLGPDYVVDFDDVDMDAWQRDLFESLCYFLIQVELLVFAGVGNLIQLTG